MIFPSPLLRYIAATDSDAAVAPPIPAPKQSRRKMTMQRMAVGFRLHKGPPASDTGKNYAERGSELVGVLGLSCPIQDEDKEGAFTDSSLLSVSCTR